VENQNCLVNSYPHNIFCGAVFIKFVMYVENKSINIKEEFIGGCDIVKEMFEKGELQTKLKENNISYKNS